MSNGYLPRADGELVAWSTQFLGMIQQEGVALGLTAPMIADYGALNDAFAAAVAACEPTVRTRGAVATKATATTALRAKASQLVRRITSDPNLTDAQRVNLGLTVPARATRRVAPADAPVLQIRTVQGRAVAVRLNGATDGNRRGKAAGSIGAILFHSRTEAMPMAAEDWCFAGLANRTDMNLMIPAGGPSFDRVWIMAQWLSPTLQPGPACRPLMAYLQAADAFLHLRHAA